MPSYATVSTYESSDPADFETVPEAQMQAAFTRSQSAPGPSNQLPLVEIGEISRTDSTGRAAGSRNTPRSARGIGKLLQAKGLQRIPLQSAEQVTLELIKSGLTTEWGSGRKLPFCVAEQLANRMNWDEAFARSIPAQSKADGVYTPQYLQKVRLQDS